MRPMYFLYLVLIIVYQGRLLSAPAKVKIPPLKIDFDSPYYKGRFAPCKSTRLLNPVETMKARHWATQVFARCGSKLIVHYASKYSVSAVVLQPLGDRICLGASLAYALRTINNGSIIPRNTPPGVLLEPIEILIKAMVRWNYTKKIVKNGKHFYIRPKPFIDFLHALLQCALQEDIPPDVDTVKHTVNYYRFIIL